MRINILTWPAGNHIVEAYQLIDKAQAANKDQLGGHGEKAKQLLSQADAELRQRLTFRMRRVDNQPVIL
jgi:hypothetical protein